MILVGLLCFINFIRDTEFSVFNSIQFLASNLKTVISQRDIGDFPGNAVDRNPPASSGDTGSLSGLGRRHMLQSS